MPRALCLLNAINFPVYSAAIRPTPTRIKSFVRRNMAYSALHLLEK